MRILVLSDIHANLEALETSLDSAPEHDQVFNLGDVVGYGANPNEVTERSRALGNVFIRGNHDKACTGLTDLDGFNPIAGLAALWTQQTLTGENLDFLRQMPKGPVTPHEGIACVHGSPRDEDEYLLVATDAYDVLEESMVPLTFFGHTHFQCGFSFDPRNGRGQVIIPRYSSPKGKQQFAVELKDGLRYLINPGSIGQPRDGDPRAAFALYDTEKNSITFHRVPYDIAGAQKRILSAGLPDRLAERLAEGR